MQQLTVLVVMLVAAVHAQFPNGRILEPPVPSQCVQRVIHERYADSMFYFFYLILGLYKLAYFFAAIVDK